MLDEKYFNKLKEKFEELEEKRDELIKDSIRITRLSKEAIYSIIRGDFDRAKERIDIMDNLVNQLKEKITSYPWFYNSISICFQEYAEAKILYYFIRENRIPTHEEMGVDEISYVGGLIDFVGELSRKATEEMIKGNVDFAMRAKDIIEHIYLKMLYMEFKNYDLRRKVDYIAGVLNSLKEKIFYKTLFKEK